MATHHGDVSHVFSGQGAEAVHGQRTIGQDVLRAEKYRRWPLPLIRLLGAVLEPIWQSKAYGARMAAAVIPYLDDPDSPHYPPNSQAMYTDWEVVNRSFGSSAVREAMAYRRRLETQYLGSSSLIERVQMITLLSDDYDTTGLERQLGLVYGRKTIFPFLDDMAVAAAMSVDPQERYFFAGRAKPLVKTVVEKRTHPDFVNKPKYSSGFGNDLPNWMRQGVLRDMVQAIERPAFVERADFKRKIEQPDWFTWNMLTLDLFQKLILGHVGKAQDISLEI
jgi:hypothetical protein